MSNKTNHKVYLLAGESPSMPLLWLTVDSAGNLIERQKASGFEDFIAQTIKNPDTISSEPYGDKFVILLPGECVALRILPSPPKGRAQFNAAARYLLEDSLAESIDNLHIVTAVRTSQNISQGLCLAISKSVMEEWHSCFVEYDVFPEMMTADFMALQVDEDHPLTVFASDNRLMVNGHQGGFCVDEGMSATLVPDIIEKWVPESIRLCTDENSKINIESDTKTHIAPNSDVNLAKLIATGPVGNTGLAVPNLLGREYARKINWRSRLGPMRGAVIAASLCAILLSSMWVLDGMRASREAKAYEKLALEIHNQAFPEARGQDPAQHARQLLGAKRGQDDFLALWLRFAQAISIQEGVEIDSIFYAANNQSLRLSIRVDGRPNLDGFLQALRSNGINADEGRMNNSNGQFTGDLVVRL